MTQHSNTARNTVNWPRSFSQVPEAKTALMEGIRQPRRVSELMDHLCLTLISASRFQHASMYLFYIIRWNTLRDKKTIKFQRSIRDERKLILNFFWSVCVEQWDKVIIPITFVRASTEPPSLLRTGSYYPLSNIPWEINDKKQKPYF